MIEYALGYLKHRYIEGKCLSDNLLSGYPKYNDIITSVALISESKQLTCILLNTLFHVIKSHYWLVWADPITIIWWCYTIKQWPHPTFYCTIYEYEMPSSLWLVKPPLHGVVKRYTLLVIADQTLLGYPFLGEMNKYT